jgi:hypothetical protein
VPKNLPIRIGKNIAGLRIREARDRCVPPITQDQLSGRLAAFGVTVDRTALAKIEKGVRGIYDYEVAAFALALRVDANWLLGITAKHTS